MKTTTIVAIVAGVLVVGGIGFMIYKRKSSIGSVPPPAASPPVGNANKSVTGQLQTAVASAASLAKSAESVWDSAKSFFS